jgi:hypothetical protein
VAATGAFFAVFASTQSNAADWSSKEFVAVTGEYNDNKRLTVAEHDTVIGSIAELALDIGRETEVSKLRLNPRLKFNRYSGEEGFDSDDQYIYTSYRYLTERSQFDIKVDYIRDSPLTSEFQDVEFVQTNKRRETWNAGPVWVHQLTESLSSNLGVNYTDAAHEDAETTGLIDYVYQSGFAGLQQSLTEATELGLTAYGSRYEAPDVENETDDAGLQASLASAYSESLTFNVNFSWHKSTVKLGPDGGFFRDTNEGRLMNLELQKRFEHSSMALSLENEIKPGSSGLLERHDRYRIDASYQFTEHTAGLLKFINTFVDDVTENPLFESWEYRQAICQLSYRIHQNWYFWGSYYYAWKKFENTDESAESNAVLLSIRYQSL